MSIHEMTAHINKWTIDNNQFSKISKFLIEQAINQDTGLQYDNMTLLIVLLDSYEICEWEINVNHKFILNN